MNRVEQVIYEGSVHEALIRKFISCQDILQFLLDNPFSIYHLIAYRVVCQFNKTQIINDKPFVLQITEDKYVAVYALSVSDPVGRTDEETFEITKRTQEVLPKTLGTNGFSAVIPLICDSPDFKIQTPDIPFWILIAARSTKLLTKYHEKMKRDHRNWLLYDYLEPLNNLNYLSYEQDLIVRCKTLKEKVSLYWSEVAIHLYQPLVSKNRCLNTLSKEQAREYKALFPDWIPDELVNMSDFKCNMRKLSDTVKAYVMGYPIHEYVPSVVILNEAIRFIEEKGINEYCELINKIPLGLNGKTVGNTEDALTENISDYNSFDVVRHYNDTHVYYFTRPEFRQMLQKKKNTWSNEYLPLSVLLEISHRAEASVILKLPDALPIKDLLEKVRSGTLVDEPKKENVQNHENRNEDEQMPQLVASPSVPHASQGPNGHGRHRDSTISVTIDDNLFRHLIHYHDCPHQHSANQICPHLTGGNEEFFEVDEDGMPLVPSYDEDD